MITIAIETIGFGVFALVNKDGSVRKRRKREKESSARLSRNLISSFSSLVTIRLCDFAQAVRIPPFFFLVILCPFILGVRFLAVVQC